MTNRVQTATKAASRQIRTRLHGRLLTLGVGAAALLLLSGFAAACGNGGGGYGGGGSTPPACSPAVPIPSAVYIGLIVPVKPIPTGGSLTVSYEFEVVNYTSADANATVAVPTLYSKFPQANNTTLFDVQFAPTSVAVNGSNWSNPVTKTVTLSAPLNFTTGGKAYLSSANLAVMIQGAGPNTTLEFRWSWTADRLGHTTTATSVPTTTPSTPYFPSIFQVAPYVHVNATSNTTAVSGSKFSIALYGAVGKTFFKTAIETPTGQELRCDTNTNWGSGSCFVFSIPLTYQNGTDLPAGNYLVHVHDSLGAIVASISISVTNASSSWGWGGWGHHGGQGGVTCGGSSSGGGGCGGHGGGWGWGARGDRWSHDGREGW